jgi:hypothetical protein
MLQPVTSAQLQTLMQSRIASQESPCVEYFCMSSFPN